MQGIAIVLLCVVMAVTYGIIHDQITARICVEYFTVAHPPIFGTDDPTLLGLGWGVVATWWVGVLLGTPLAAVARLGPWPKRSMQSLVRPLALLMGTSGLVAFIAGLIGRILARAGTLTLSGWLADTIPHEKQAAFITDACAHTASYAAGFCGGGIVILLVGVQRWKASRRMLPQPLASQQQVG